MTCTNVDYLFELKKAFIEESVSGFGFLPDYKQFPTIIIGSVLPHDDENFQSHVRQITGSASFFLHRGHVGITADEWNLIPVIFSACVEAGVPYVQAYCTGMSPQPKFRGQPFSYEESERLYVERFVDIVEADAGWHTNPWKYFYDYYRCSDALLEYYNWRTPIGKLFCDKLRQHILRDYQPPDSTALEATPPWYEEHDEVCRHYGVLHHGSWSKLELVRSTNNSTI